MKLYVLCERDEVASHIDNMALADIIISPNRPADNCRWYQLLPHIMRGEGGVEIDESADGVLIRNLEELGFVRSLARSFPAMADTSLYAMNRDALELLYQSGVQSDSVPLELSLRELEQRGVKNTCLVVYGRAAMMISAQCVRLTRGAPCTKRAAAAGAARSSKNVQTAKGEKGPSYQTETLTDRFGVAFPVVCNCRYCYNVIYNSVPLLLDKYLPAALKLGISAIRVDLTTESVKDAERIVSYFAALLSGKTLPCPVESFTRGHFARGIE